MELLENSMLDSQLLEPGAEVSALARSLSNSCSVFELDIVCCNDEERTSFQSLCMKYLPTTQLFALLMPPAAVKIVSEIARNANILRILSPILRLRGRQI